MLPWLPRAAGASAGLSESGWAPKGESAGSMLICCGWGPAAAKGLLAAADAGDLEAAADVGGLLCRCP